MSEPAHLRLGIDLGGTKIEAIAIDGSGRELERQRIATPRGDYGSTVRAIAGLVSGIENALGRRGSVGIGIPGAVSPSTGTIKNANSTWLIGRPFDRDVAAALGRPVRLANDANCFALSEARDGAGAGAEIVFGIILGTGVGGGIIVRGRPLVGRNAIAGEWGHNPLPWPRDGERPGPECYCGRRGCIETFLSGPGLARDHALAGGGDHAADRIAAHAAAGDAGARATMHRYLDRLGRALAHVVNILDPDVIVLGGGLSNIDSLTHGWPERMAAYVFSNQVDTRVVRNRHGDSSGVRGAAWLWAEDEVATALGGARACL
ncbi:MAG TPA: ROK family protein [Kiloniellales bacterium]